MFDLVRVFVRVILSTKLIHDDYKLHASCHTLAMVPHEMFDVGLVFCLVISGQLHI